jgi:hypothetical protein
MSFKSVLPIHTWLNVVQELVYGEDELGGKLIAEHLVGLNINFTNIITASLRKSLTI